MRAANFFPALMLAACASMASAQPYPEFRASDAEAVIVSARLVSARYLDPFPECEQPDHICMDPPPILLGFRLHRSLWGPAPTRYFEVATTSHFGVGTFPAERDDLWLVPMLTDGMSYVLPRYGMGRLHRNGHGDWAVVASSAELLPWWLPCRLAEAIEEMSFGEALGESLAGLLDQAAFEIEGIDTDEDAQALLADPTARESMLEKIAGWAEIRGDLAVPRFGLALTDLQARLAEQPPTPADLNCESDAREALMEDESEEEEAVDSAEAEAETGDPEAGE